MTKIRNTKKGMAKKTLSISLAVAMLATSNVPVWAAEDLFTDGEVAVEAFTSDVEEAPVVEEDVETPIASDAITTIDVSNINITNNTDKDVKNGSVVFGDKLFVRGSVLAGSTPLSSYKYAWKVLGETNAFKSGDVDTVNGSVAVMDLETLSYESIVGSTVQLFIYKNEEDIVTEGTLVGSVRIDRYNLDSAKLLLNYAANSDKGYEGKKLKYNGKPYTYGVETDSTKNTISIKGFDLGVGDSDKIEAGDWDVTTVLKYYDITTTGPATNAGEKLVITATQKTDSPYANAKTISVEVEISPKTWVAGDIVATLKKPLTYQYTGKKITVEKENFTLKEKANAYANADLSDAVTYGTVGADNTANVATPVGNDQTVWVHGDVSLIKNWALDTFAVPTAATDNTVDVKARDLSETSTTITMTHGKVPDGTTPADLGRFLTFKGTEAGTPTLKLDQWYYDQPVDYTLVVINDAGIEVAPTTHMDPGTYTVKVSAHGANTEGTQTITIVVGDDVITDYYFAAPYSTVYTGAKIEPTKSDLGNFVIKDEKYNGTSGARTLTITPSNYEIVSYENNTDATRYKNGTPVTSAYVTVKVLESAGVYPGRTFKVPFTILPLTVSESTVTVPTAVSYNGDYTTAAEYNIPLVVTAADENGKNVKGLSDKDFTISYAFTTANVGNEIGNSIKATLKITNPNFMGTNGQHANVELTNKTTQIVAKALTDSMIYMTPASYTYTGTKITPNFVVRDNGVDLYDEAEYGTTLGEYRVTGCVKNLDVGTGKVTIEGIDPKYSGTASATFEITPANTKDVKVEVKDQNYTGRQIRPHMTDVKVTLNDVDVTNQFELVADGFGGNVDNKGTLTLKTKATSKNFTGANVTTDFKIVKEVVAATMHVFDSYGADVTADYSVTDANIAPVDWFTGSSFDFDGIAKEFASSELKNIHKISGGLPNVGTKATVADFEIKYADNISGKATDLVEWDGTKVTGHFNIGYVYAVAKEGTGYTGNETLTLADGTKITGVVAYMPFAIKNVEFGLKNVVVTNAEYAGGISVNPEVLVQVKGNTLVEGKDYKLVRYGATETNPYTNVTTNKSFTVDIIGLGGYAGSAVWGQKWGIDKKDIKACDVKVTNGVTTVMNGYIPVPVTEYTSTKNADGTYTVAAVKTSKNYLGSVTVKADGQAADEKPKAPYIKYVDVVGNKATVILSGDSEGAVGYDYVISTDRDCITNKDYDKVNKNKLATETTFTYTQQGVYYAYCHAWKRDENGKKIFSDWSNAYPFAVSAITPAQPVITGYKVNGNTVTVTYTKAENADGYDVVLGSTYGTVLDERRPLQYGELVKKNIKGNTVTATFKNVQAGTYYAGLHAFNRTAEDGKKVFSPWSNIKTIKVK